MSVWTCPVLGMSAEFSVERVNIGIYDDRNQLLAGMAGPILGISGTTPIDVVDTDRVAAGRHSGSPHHVDLARVMACVLHAPDRAAR